MHFPSKRHVAPKNLNHAGLLLASTKLFRCCTSVRAVVSSAAIRLHAQFTLLSRPANTSRPHEPELHCPSRCGLVPLKLDVV